MATILLTRKAGQDGIAKDGTAHFKEGSHPGRISGGERMKAISTKTSFELEIGIEELEPKVAPDGGETVLPLPKTHHK